jgi:hypothetical protein
MNPVRSPSSAMSAMHDLSVREIGDRGELKAAEGTPSARR